MDHLWVRMVSVAGGGLTQFITNSVGAAQLRQLGRGFGFSSCLLGPELSGGVLTNLRF